MDQEDLLSDVLCEFARTLLTDFPIQAILDQLVSRIVDVLPVTSAGVTLIAPDRAPHYIAASNATALEYEKLQSDLGEGPCLIAYRTGEAVSVPDLAHEDRFPNFGPQAIAAGLAAVFTFPLRHGQEQLGALDLYRESPGALDDRTLQSAQTLADVTTAYLLNARAREELHTSSDQYRESALHDALTGLPNRVLLHQRLEHASRRARRSHTTLAILFIDLDRFKQVNDAYGHRAGDELLVAVADRLQRLVRAGDTVARMSGDEFVILCEDLDTPQTAEVLAARVVGALGPPFLLASRAVSISASVGIAFAGPGDHVPERVLNDADEAMYQAKRAGGSRHQLIDLRERSRMESRSSLEDDLHWAAARGELRLDYQPIVRTVGREITAFESLLRWEHPRRGLIPPNVFIPLAEQSDLIVEIGDWVLRRACIDRRRVQRVVDDRELNVCVNVSPHQLMRQGFCDSINSILTETATDPHHLTLEVTESVYVEDSARALIVLQELQRLGVVIALDDFGTGFSSLSHLQQFPIDIVKIDRRFISQLGNQRISEAIVTAVINLAHALDRVAVAEGVETADQHRQLTKLGCDACQGFYFATPMSVDALEQRLSGAA